MKRSLFTIIASILLCLTASAQVYILGTVNGHSWSPFAANAVEMTAQGDGIYTADVTVDNNNNGYGFFSFTTTLANDGSENGWNDIAESRFGAKTKNDGDNFQIYTENVGKSEYYGQMLDKWIELGESGTEIALKLKAGFYTLKVDLTNHKLTVEDHLYVIGMINKYNEYPWNASKGTEMLWDGRVFKKECYVQGASEADPNGYFTFVGNLSDNWNDVQHFGVNDDVTIADGDFDEVTNQYSRGIERGSGKSFKIPAGFYFVEVLGNTVGGQTLYLTRREASTISFSEPAGDVEQNTTINITSTLKSRIDAIDGNGAAVKTEYSLDNGETWIEGESFTLNDLGAVKVMARATCGQLKAEATINYTVKEPLDVATRWKINEENFPDNALRDYIWNHLVQIGATENVDAYERAARGTDNIIVDIWEKGFTKYDLERVTTITMKGVNVSELAGTRTVEVEGESKEVPTGVALFPNLQNLDVEESNALTSVDLTPCTALEHVSFFNSSISSFTLADKTKIKYLNLGQTKILPSTVNIADYTILEHLYWENKEPKGDEYLLTELDVTTLPTLIDLVVNDNKLTKLDVTHNPALVDLEFSQNLLTDIDLTKNTALEVLYCTANHLGQKLNADGSYTDLESYKLNLDNNKAMKVIDCAFNSISILDLSEHENFTYIRCANNWRIPEVNVKKCLNLDDLDCSGTDIPSLDLSNNTVLTRLTMADLLNENFTTINLKNNPELDYFRCSNCPYLSPVDLSVNTKITYLEAMDNNFREFDISPCTILEELRISGNDKLTDNVKGLDNLTTTIKTIEVANCNLTNIKLTNKPNLVVLDCKENNLYELDVTGNTLLQRLTCGNNHINALDLSKNTELSEERATGDVAHNYMWFGTDNNGRTVQAERAHVYGSKYMDYLRLEGDEADMGKDEMLLKDRIDNPVGPAIDYHGESNFVLSNVVYSNTNYEEWVDETTPTPAPRRVSKTVSETYQWRDAYNHDSAYPQERVNSGEDTDNTKGKILVLQEGTLEELDKVKNSDTLPRIEYHYATGNEKFPVVTFYLDWQVSTVVTGIEDIKSDAANESENAITNRIYYSVDGRAASMPHDGVNVVVTTYSDGHRTVSKQLIK